MSRELNSSFQHMSRGMKGSNFSFPSSNSPSFFIAVLFTMIGVALWIYGKKKRSDKAMFVAVILMFYGYFIPNIWITLSLGALLILLALWRKSY